MNDICIIIYILWHQSINQHHKNVKIPSPGGRSVYTNKTEKCSKFKCSRVYVYVHTCRV